jgi:hypothetical protein
MPKTKVGQTAIPRFSSEAAEAEWWNAHRAEVEVDIQAKLTNLGERTAADINERAARMTPEKRAQADSETKEIADRVQRRTR